MVQVEFITAVSKKHKTERKNAEAIANVETKQLPDVPIKRPKPIHERKLKKGNIKIQRYIKKKC
jgi:hypothetical protein